MVKVRTVSRIASSGLVVLVILVVVAMLANQRDDRTQLWPTHSELAQQDRASALVGEWIYEGSIIHEDNEFYPAESTLIQRFTADGLMTIEDEDDSYDERYSWTIDKEGRLDMAGEDGSFSVPTFFFRDDKLYIEGDSAWDRFRRR